MTQKKNLQTKTFYATLSSFTSRDKYSQSQYKNTVSLERGVHRTFKTKLQTLFYFFFCKTVCYFVFLHFFARKQILHDSQKKNLGQVVKQISVFTFKAETFLIGIIFCLMKQLFQFQFKFGEGAAPVGTRDENRLASVGLWRARLNGQTDRRTDREKRGRKNGLPQPILK